ncbi:hypothetical protein GBF38_003883 [Nibea albiflora]|uniref:Uncharacterized protein n=1 Tax=Nibea albiflora TaxID=240163 RepID=A0ACB7FAS7_NIBAL|nr:hypothetical protein GBF38_003883 [Nibea albiflora]
MGDVISSHLDEAKREIITGEERCAEVCLVCVLSGLLAHVRLYAAVTDCLRKMRRNNQDISVTLRVRSDFHRLNVSLTGCGVGADPLLQ